MLKTLASIFYITRKWFWCSWKHAEHRCYPEVWLPNSTAWHCAKCHPCNEGLAEVLGDVPEAFTRGLGDMEAGRVVALDVALREPLDKV